MSPQANIQQDRVPALDEWQYHLSEVLTGGEDSSLRSELIEEGGVIDAENLYFHKGRAVNDYGYKKFGGNVIGDPRKDWQFLRSDGALELVLVTNITIYTWSEGVLEWQYVSNGTDTTLAVAAVATDTTIDVVDAAGFADGERIGILLDDGTQHQTLVDGAPAGNVITLIDAIPSAAAIGKIVVEAVLLTGNSDLPVSIVTWAAKDRMYFTNGVDTPRFYDGSTCEVIANLPGSTFSCRIIVTMHDRLLLLYTVEDGTTFPQRERWSDAGFDDAWNASVNFNDFYQTEDWITAALPLGPFLIIYKDHTIIRQAFLGEIDKTWSFVQTIDGEGAVSYDAVVSLDDVHILFGNSNIYKYSGEFDLEPIGDEIYNKIFSIEGNLNVLKVGNTFLIYVRELDEIWSFYSKSSEESPKDSIRYKVPNEAYSHRVWPININGFGFYQAKGGLRWIDEVGIWETDKVPWVRRAFLDNAPTIHLCATDSAGNGQVYEYDYVEADDDGALIPYKFESKDYYNPSDDLRFDRFDFSILGTNVLIEYSTDKGVSWVVLGTKSSPSAYSRVSIWKQFIASRIRYRLSGSGPFGLEWLAMKFRVESGRR